MPRARLIVDGYNVTKTAWPASSLEAQRIRLLGVAGPAGRADRRRDHGRLRRRRHRHRPPVNAPRGVRVLFSPRGVIADDVIRDLVAAEPRGPGRRGGHRDQAVARDVTRAGARAVPPEALLTACSPAADGPSRGPAGGRLSVVAAPWSDMTTRIDCDTCMVRGLRATTAW